MFVSAFSHSSNDYLCVCVCIFSPYNDYLWVCRKYKYITFKTCIEISYIKLYISIIYFTCIYIVNIHIAYGSSAVWLSHRCLGSSDRVDGTYHCVMNFPFILSLLCVFPVYVQAYVFHILISSTLFSHKLYHCNFNFASSVNTTERFFFALWGVYGGCSRGVYILISSDAFLTMCCA